MTLHIREQIPPSIELEEKEEEEVIPLMMDREPGTLESSYAMQFVEGNLDDLEG